jgi:hypothetical protein
MRQLAEEREGVTVDDISEMPPSLPPFAVD